MNRLVRAWQVLLGIEGTELELELARDELVQSRALVAIRDDMLHQARAIAANEMTRAAKLQGILNEITKLLRVLTT